MRKKSKKLKETTLVTAAANVIVNTPDVPPALRLTEIQASARVHFDNKAWVEILALGRLPLTAIHKEDRKAAAIWQLRAKILGLYPPGTVSEYDLPIDAREELEGALEQLALCVNAPHTLPEFDLYLDINRWSIDGCAKRLHCLARACMEVANVDWIRKLRARALTLLGAREWGEEELSDADKQTLADLPDITLVLSEVYVAAERSDTLDEEGRVLVNVWRIDLDLMMADPWDYVQFAEAILLLPSPSESDLVTIFNDEPMERGQLRITPRAWAFMWLLKHTPGVGFTDLLQRFPEPFACDACEGLRRVLFALLSAPADVDNHLSLAISALMRSLDDSHCFGRSLTIVLSDGLHDVYVGHSGLHMAPVEDLLLRLYEHSPEDFSKRAELESFYRIFRAFTLINDFDPLEDEDHGHLEMPGLAWLCEQSISFQFAAACVIKGVASRMLLLIDAMRRTTNAGVPPPRGLYLGDLKFEDLTETEAGPLLDAMKQLAEVRSQMDEKTQHMWIGVAGEIFGALSKLDNEVQSQLLPVARDFSDDLLEKGYAFRLAYLEQVVGDLEDALHYYLIDLDTSESVPEASVKNAKLLWARSEDLSQVQRFVDKLQKDERTSSRADVVKLLLADAKARLASLNKRDQFELTAVNRWPLLTGPARKLLGVFASIKSYNGLSEVAEYAGMDLTWAGRHYDKLVELGMLFVTDKTFRVNPHIRPLIERESQHAVIGRILRCQGTSAVKQLFNSQVEFTIYQVFVQLCPNQLVFPNCSLQSIMSYECMKELVGQEDFGYYLRASVDIVVVSSTTYLPMFAIEVDSVWHDTERQQRNDDKKDRLFVSAGIPFMRLRPVGSVSEDTIRAQVAQHADELVRSLRADLPGYDKARRLLEDLSGIRT